MIVMPMRFEDVFGDKIGDIFMIDKFLKNILLKIDKNSIYEYVIYNDEMTFMIDDIIEIESCWYDIELMFGYYKESPFFLSGEVISESIKENGCLAIIKSTDVVKENLKMLMEMSKKEMERAYNELKNNMTNSFEINWEFLNKLKVFYLRTVQFNRNILLFC